MFILPYYERNVKIIFRFVLFYVFFLTIRDIYSIIDYIVFIFYGDELQ